MLTRVLQILKINIVLETKIRFQLLFKYTQAQARFRNLSLYLVSIGINKIFNGHYIIEPSNFRTQRHTGDLWPKILALKMRQLRLQEDKQSFKFLECLES